MPRPVETSVLRSRNRTSCDGNVAFDGRIATRSGPDCRGASFERKVCGFNGPGLRGRPAIAGIE
ncbi:hypothetical protein PSMK_06450 [Phycisphaera mikurensis NBRC 102666]|uniref:Uncharacterized protein n=1 Tax=Phycisphaera mikurensis (strain NBRC 102666 / KCTC 22515 / FYK2301M01) TaxID=1142394 RepID=I0IC16_PHYMF|nr:hypothetical protein PSMK_06450 [Phycisphaera mikurensis NBRC 102666]